MINELKQTIITFWEKKRYLSVFSLCAAFILFLVATAPNSDLFLEPYEPTVVTPAPTEPAPVVPDPIAPAPSTPEPTPAPVVTTPEPAIAVSTSSGRYIDGKGGRVVAVKPAPAPHRHFTIDTKRIDDRSVYGYFLVEVSYTRMAGYDTAIPQPQFNLEPNGGSCQLSNQGVDQYVIACDIQNAASNYQLTVSASGQTSALNISWQ